MKLINKICLVILTLNLNVILCEELKIIHGTFNNYNTDEMSRPIAGEGFATSGKNGVCKVTFNVPFKDTPTIIASPSSTKSGSGMDGVPKVPVKINITQVTPNNFEISSSYGTLHPSAESIININFLAIGS